MKKLLLLILAAILLSGCSLGETTYYIDTILLQGKHIQVNEYNSRGEIVCGHMVLINEDGFSETITANKATRSVQVPKESTYYKMARITYGTDGRIALHRGDVTRIFVNVDF